MGLAGFVVPFLFVYRPAVLLAASPLLILWESLVSALAVIALAGGAIGYFGDTCKWYESILLIAGAVFLIWPGLTTDLIGIFVVGIIFLLQKRRHAGAGKHVAMSTA
jgi:TRAP-type uncharacterized transport system fused permease subunit